MKAVTIGTAGNLFSEGEVWGFNDFHARPGHRPADRWFQLHPPSILVPSEWDTAHKWAGPGPLYVLDADDEVWKGQQYAQSYPRRAIELQFGPGPWAGSHDYMLALALHEGFDRLYISRADFQIGAPRERLCEHASFAYWVGLARGRGATVTWGGTSLCYPHAYGYDFDPERTWAQRMVFWAALGMLHFDGFDDGQAMTAVRGWNVTVDPSYVNVAI